MITCAVTNQKGGVGKTGVTVSLAGALAERGYDVLVVDLEPQATATEWLGARPAGRPGELPEDVYGPPLLEALLHGKPLPYVETSLGIDLVPSGNQLNAFDIEASQIPAGQRELLLRNALGQLGPKWDVVLIDCPPSLSLLTINALAAANRTLMPVKLDSASRTPLVRLFIATAEIQRTLNPELDLVGIIPTFYEKTGRHSSDVLEWLRGQFDQSEEGGEDASDLVFANAIRKSTHVAESHAAQLPISHYARREKLRGSIGAEDIEAVADEFIHRTELGPISRVANA